jgi:predicted short-subunit dehydrogenase-like oxidoreductase (DUF2520 family)
MKIAVLGPGRVGRPLSEAFGRQGHEVVTYDREAITKKKYDDLPGADLAFLTLPDRILTTMARNITAKPKHGLVHCSGQTRNADLGAQVAMFHPMMSFTNRDTARIFQDCPIGISSEDAQVKAMLVHLAEEIGGVPFVLAESMKETYHLAGMFASVFPLLLLFKSRELLERAGISKEDAVRIVTPIFRRAADHLETGDPSGTITGPVPREDWMTIKAHLEQLSGDEASREIYRALTRLCYQYCSLNERTRKTMEEVLS